MSPLFFKKFHTYIHILERFSAALSYWSWGHSVSWPQSSGGSIKRILGWEKDSRPCHFKNPWKTSTLYLREGMGQCQPSKSFSPAYCDDLLRASVRVWGYFKMKIFKIQSCKSFPHLIQKFWQTGRSKSSLCVASSLKRKPRIKLSFSYS